MIWIDYYGNLWQMKFDWDQDHVKWLWKFCDCWAVCACVFTSASCFDMRWLSCDCWPTFWASFRLWQGRPSETFEPCQPFITHDLECPSWVFKPLLVIISRTWLDSLQNCNCLVLNVDMIESFICLLTHMSQKLSCAYIIPLLTPAAFSPLHFIHVISIKPLAWIEQSYPMPS